jgi:hypothetical protein
MTLKSAGSRAMLIEELALDVARYRMSDTTCILPADRIVTDDDRRFVLCLLRQAAPLYPLPTGDEIPQDKQKGDVLRVEHLKAGLAIRPRAHGGGDA